MKFNAALVALLPVVAAWPTAMEMDAQIKRARAGAGRLNTGAGHPDPGFDSKGQYVDVSDSSVNKFIPPGPKDLRGQCPGLNAAANHGFLPRNGLATPQQTAAGLEAAYNMSPELAIGLAVIAIYLSGDIPTTTWSIGGAFGPSVAGLGQPKGIVGTHNKYEGDASIVRGDAYLNNGNVGVFQYRSWNNLMSLIQGKEDHALEKTIQQSHYVTQYSIHNNPYYFSGPFSGLVAPAAHNFAVNFMSNHTAEYPGGYLTQEILKCFFAVTGDGPNNYQHHRGQERIPYNWWKRPGGVDRYNVPDVFLDLVAGAAQYPDTVQFGGNLGKTDTFTGADLGNVSGGVYNGQNIFDGNNLACFAFQAATAGDSDELNGFIGSLSADVLALLAPLQQELASLGCPQLKSYSNQDFNKFPGFGYKGSGLDGDNEI